MQIRSYNYVYSNLRLTAILCFESWIRKYLDISIVSSCMNIPYITSTCWKKKIIEVYSHWVVKMGGWGSIFIKKNYILKKTSLFWISSEFKTSVEFQNGFFNPLVIQFVDQGNVVLKYIKNIAMQSSLVWTERSYCRHFWSITP